MTIANPYTLYLRDNATKTRLGQIDQFISFVSKSRFNDVGTWVLELDYAHPLVNQFGLDMGVILQRGEEVIFSGPMNNPRVSWANGERTMQVSGFDDLVYLTQRLALPEPSTASPPYNTDEFDERTGVGSTVIQAYVAYNLGSSARTGRPETGFTLGTDLFIGSSITGYARFHILLDFIRELAIRAGDLGLQVLDKEFSVYSPTDLTDDVVFSEGLGNIASYEYQARNPTLNYLFVADEDAGIARTVVELSDSNSISEFGLFESFLNKPNTSDTDEMTDAGNVELEKGKEVGSVSFEPRESNQVFFQQDYKLGDKVVFRLDTTTDFENIIREVEIDISGGETRTSVIMATSSESTNPEIFNLFAGRNRKSLDIRLSELERK